jgi:hypothetical protein
MQRHIYGMVLSTVLCLFLEVEAVYVSSVVNDAAYICENEADSMSFKHEMWSCNTQVYFRRWPIQRRGYSPAWMNETRETHCTFQVIEASKSETDWLSC